MWFTWCLRILHALGPDHLSAIALFSIGKKRKQALSLSLLFALGHGLTLYLLSLGIQYFANEELLAYGDIISALAILGMGTYLIYLALSNKIKINTHHHHHHKHTHIYYKDKHLHDKSMLFSIGVLMGVGGLRGMLVTLSIASHQAVSIDVIFAFILGVSTVFVSFGYLIYLINEKLLFSINGLRFAIFSVGFFSLAIGFNTLIGFSNAL